MRLLLIFLLGLVQFQSIAQDSIKSPKNVILMIGDGMGFAQITAAKYSKGSPLFMEQFPVTGFLTTHSLDNRVTDSGAAGTALACGIKTYNGAIGVDIDTLPVQSILEELNLEGFTTGLIVTCDINHATPAAFFGHQPSRNMYEALAADLLNTDIELFIGGGRSRFDQRESDDRHLITELNKKGYSILDIKDNPFESINISSHIKLGYFTADIHPDRYLNGRTYLPEATEFGLKFLHAKSKKGFFVMIEGSQIDWAGHDNNTDHIIAETLDFDRTVGVALDFVKNDKETLLIVLADHEIGGMGINKVNKDGTMEVGYTTDGHTGTLVPIMAIGPGAEFFGGFLDNTDVYHLIRKLMLNR